MAVFVIKRKRIIMIQKPESSTLVQGPQGLQVFTDPAKTFELDQKDFDPTKLGIEITDPEQIERVRKDPAFNTEEIREITTEDIQAIKIRNKKLKEAEEEIKKLKSSDASAK